MTVPVPPATSASGLMARRLRRVGAFGAVVALTGFGLAIGTTDAFAAPGGLGAPTLNSVTHLNASATLNFTPGTDTGDPITSYDVSLDGGTTFADIGVTATAGAGSTFNATIAGLTNGTAYPVAIRDDNGAGAPGESAASNAMTVTPSTVPNAPTGLIAAHGNTTALLTFTPPVNNGGSAITGYDVSTDGGATFPLLGVTTAAGAGSTLTTTLTGLTNGTALTVAVRADNLNGSSAASLPTTVTPSTVPNAPTALSAVPGNTTAVLTFTPPAGVGTGGSAITGYDVSVDGGATFPLTSVVTTGASPLTTTLTGLTNGTALTVAVRADNLNGSSVASLTTTVTPATVPDAPTGLAAIAGDTTALLTFTPPTVTGGSPLLTYDVSLTGAAPWTLTGITPVSGFVSGVFTSTITLTGLTDGITYTVAVRVHNVIGASAGSTTASVMPTVGDVLPAVIPGGFGGGGGGGGGGGTTTTPPVPVVAFPGTPVTVPPVGVVPLPSVGVPSSGGGTAVTPDGNGYWVVSPDGSVMAFGDAQPFGSMAGQALAAPIVGIAATPDGLGYWEVAADGGVFAFGDASYHGSMGGIALNAPIVAITVTPDGGGYWLVGADGGVFAFGDAGQFGSMGGTHLNESISGLTATADGQGYWMVATDGGVFAFGSAGFFGSMGGGHLNEPIVALAAGRAGMGYWMVGADGGVFSFGDAGFHGSTGSTVGGSKTVGIIGTASGNGYGLILANGHISNFGDSQA